MKTSKILPKLSSGSKNVKFSELENVVEAFGFQLSRINGSHHIYEHPDVPELINIQDVDGKAKPYQVKQLLQLIDKYDLQLERK